MRLIKWCAVACVVSILAVGLAVLVGRNQPAPAILAALKLDTCKFPCWIGIVPGITTNGDALRIIRDTYPNDKYTMQILYGSQIFITLKDTSEKFMVRIEDITNVGEEDLPIGDIWLVPDDSTNNGLRVGDFFWWLGTPRNVRLAVARAEGEPVTRFGDGLFIYSESTVSCAAVSIYDRIVSLFMPAGEPGDWLTEAERWHG